jgi:ComF family protein
VHWLWQAALDLLFPPRCQVCLAFDRSPICADCTATIQPLLPPYCDICGRPFDPQAKGGPLCADCRQHRSRLDIMRAVTVYDGAMREAIHRLKYARKRILARPLGALMADYLGDGGTPDGPRRIVPGEVEVVCPVPLHPARARERGFNQSELLAREICERVGLALDASLLRRVRDTAPQVSLDRRDRAANVRGAFAAAAPDRIEGRRVLLVDDLATTGATLEECARVLRRAGAASVAALTLARAGRS